MSEDLAAVIGAYDPTLPLERAVTIPSAWYTDPRVLELERRAVFGGSWQVLARLDQLAEPGCWVSAELAGEPLVVVRGRDGELRAFYNVCRHHAAAVCPAPAGKSAVLRCPYHGWTYGLDGRLEATPELDGVCDFDRSANGLVPVRLATWEHFVLVCLDDAAPPLADFLGGLAARIANLDLGALRFAGRKSYELDCNWKVFVDNYLDGGYHVPYLHRGLGSVLDNRRYEIECEGNFCLQSSPIETEGGEAETAAVRGGKAAYYYWLYPNFMLNWYEGYLDTNLVLPLGLERCRVVFDFWLADPADPRAAGSLQIADRIQQEDEAICASVQRGLGSRAYDVGRLSVRREAGEHLFHRLLHADLTKGRRSGVGDER